MVKGEKKMKRIIEKKIYNTETSELIAEWSNGLSRGDFEALEETLYRTKNGAWFLAGSGGPKTRYAVTCGGSSSGSEDITPLDAEDVLEWMEQHNFMGLIEQYFGDQIEEA